MSSDLLFSPYRSFPFLFSPFLSFSLLFFSFLIFFIFFFSFCRLRELRITRYVSLCPQLPQYNTHSNSLPIINAVLTAGLYPKIIRHNKATQNFEIFNRTHSNIHTNTPNTTIVDLHPSSINFRDENLAKSEWLVYHTMVKSSKIFAWDSSAVSPFFSFFFPITQNLITIQTPIESH